MLGVMADLTPSVTPSAAGLRALAHPTQLKMLMRLRVGGPSTGPHPAPEPFLNPGAPSSHHRQLAGPGFIFEDTGRGDAGARGWKAAHGGPPANLPDRRDDEDAE